MELSISPRRAFQIGFIICTLLAGVYLALFMLSIGLSGTGAGDTAELEIYVGQGSLRVEHAGNTFRDDSGFSDGSGTYRYDRVWDESNESVSKNFIVEGGKGTPTELPAGYEVVENPRNGFLTIKKTRK